MKWGVRRYQNEDGSYKGGAKGRYDDGHVNKARGGSTGGSTQKKKSWSTKKKVAVGLGVAAGLAGTALAARYGHRALALGKGAKAAAKLRGAASKIKGAASRFRRSGSTAVGFVNTGVGSTKGASKLSRAASKAGERLRGVKARVGSPGDIAKRAGSAVKGAAGRAGNAAKTSATKVGNKARDLKTRMTGLNEKAYKGKRAQAFKDMVKTSNKAEYKKSVDNLEKLRNRRKKFENVGNKARDLKTRMTGLNEKAYKGKRAQAFKDMVKTGNKAEYKKSVDNLEKLRNRRKKFENAATTAKRAGSKIKTSATNAGSKIKTSAAKAGNKARDLKTRATGISEKAYKGQRAQAFKDMVKTSNKAEYKKTVDNLEKLRNRRKKFTNAAIAAGGASAVGGTAIGYNQYQKRKKR